MPDTINTKIPPFVEKYNALIKAKSEPHSEEEKEASHPQFAIPPSKVQSRSAHKYSESTSWSSAKSQPYFDKAASVDSSTKQQLQRGMHQQSKHETFALLSRIFDLQTSRDDLQTSFLSVWTDLSQAFRYENLFAILDFILKKVEEAKALKNISKETLQNILSTVKNIFFAIYEPQLNRAVMTVYIIRIILNVLQIGVEDYRQKGLMVKQRAGEILTILEQRLAKQEREEFGNADDYVEIWWNREILDISAAPNKKKKKKQQQQPLRQRNYNQNIVKKAKWEKGRIACFDCRIVVG